MLYTASFWVRKAKVLNRRSGKQFSRIQDPDIWKIDSPKAPNKLRLNLVHSFLLEVLDAHELPLCTNLGIFYECLRKKVESWAIIKLTKL